jgi:hypothetical protein
MNTVMTLLGAAGSNNQPTIEQMIHTIQSGGFEALNAAFVAAYPTVFTALPNGIKADFGAGFTGPTGDVVSGSVTTTYSNLVRSSSQVSFDYAATVTDLHKNGAVVPIQTGSGHVGLTVDGSGHVAGDASVAATGTIPQSALGVLGLGMAAVSATGTAHIDTAQCAKYPVSGTININADGQAKSVGFNSSCDGTYTYTDANAETYVMWSPVVDRPCSYTTTTYALPYSFLKEYGRLVPNPSFVSLIKVFRSYQALTFTGGGPITAGQVSVDATLDLTDNGKRYSLNTKLTAPAGTPASGGRPRYDGTGTFTFTDYSVQPPCVVTGNGSAYVLKCPPGSAFPCTS